MSNTKLSVDDLTDEQCKRLLRSIFGIEDGPPPPPDPEAEKKLKEFIEFIKKTEGFKEHKEEI